MMTGFGDVVVDPVDVPDDTVTWLHTQYTSRSLTDEHQ